MKLVTYSNKYSIVGMDPHWKRLLTAVIVGPTGIGKTVFVRKCFLILH